MIPWSHASNFCAIFWDFSVLFLLTILLFLSSSINNSKQTALVASWVRKGWVLFGICYCRWLNGHSSWMWWMLGGRRSRQGKKKSRRKKGIEKMWKKQQRKIFISIFHIHSRDISIMDIFLMPRTCYMLMLMLFHLIFPFPTLLSFPFFFSFFLSSSSSFEWLLKWDFLNRERKTCEGRVCCMLGGHL